MAFRSSVAAIVDELSAPDGHERSIGIGEAASANATDTTLAALSELRHKALSEEFSAAWGDEWNPNPLSDLSI